MKPRRLAPGLALIFDMDGVVIDSNPVHREVWAEFCRRDGVEATEEMLRFMYGRRNDQIVRHYFGEGLPADEVAARGAARDALYREIVAERLGNILIPGVREFLESYREAPMALATNADAATADFLLDRAGLRSYFRVVINGQQVKHPKPDPEIYLRAAAVLETDPADCIVFEDSHLGVEAAQLAGTRIVGLSTTEVNLPGTRITVDNFVSGQLSEWLQAQRRIA